ncbi:MAG: hypothetical protein KatS3mg022_1777 [Armatimonadota bacterium]|nr:MAG: hypothetical protein KatS3mg022_1777 [Armatimonadota bacterium]
MHCLPLGDNMHMAESDADFSPDGQYLAFARGEYEATDLYICRIDGTGLRKLTNFYPDGQAKGQSTQKVAQSPVAPKGNAKPAPPAKQKQKKQKGAPFPLLAPPVPLKRH